MEPGRLSKFGVCVRQMETEQADELMMQSAEDTERVKPREKSLVSREKRTYLKTITLQSQSDQKD